MTWNRSDIWWFTSVAAPENHNVIISEFREKLEECTIKAVCHRNFVLVEKLKEWMMGRLGPILDAACHCHDIFPPSSNKISTGDGCCLLVFSILLSLDAGHLVDRFQGRITDQKLPIDLQLLENAFKGAWRRGPLQRWDYFEARKNTASTLTSWYVYISTTTSYIKRLQWWHS